jgi:hypothetical protein
MRHIEVKRPDWIAHSTPQRSIDLFNSNLLPRQIAGWMIVVGLRHPLRSVYGTDLRAAFALLLWALWDKLENIWWAIRFEVWPPKDELEEYGDYEDRDQVN